MSLRLSEANANVWAEDCRNKESVMEKANATSTVVLFHISYFNVTLSLLIDADAVTLCCSVLIGCYNSRVLYARDGCVVRNF
jgi:hypothetical protein